MSETKCSLLFRSLIESLGDLRKDDIAHDVVTLRLVRLVTKWVTVFGRVNHLGAEPGT